MYDVGNDQDHWKQYSIIYCHLYFLFTTLKLIILFSLYFFIVFRVFNLYFTHSPLAGNLNLSLVTFTSVMFGSLLIGFYLHWINRVCLTPPSNSLTLFLETEPNASKNWKFWIKINVGFVRACFHAPLRLVSPKETNLLVFVLGLNQTLCT